MFSWLKNVSKGLQTVGVVAGSQVTIWIVKWLLGKYGDMSLRDGILTLVAMIPTNILDMSLQAIAVAGVAMLLNLWKNKQLLKAPKTIGLE